MKVFQRLAHAFKAEGVDATFGMMGDGNMFWLHEMHKLGIKVHEVRHEGAGLGMADGYARTPQKADNALIQSIADGSRAGTHSIKQIILELTQSDAFLYRAPVTP